MTSGAKLEVSPHLPPYSEPKVTKELAVPIRNHTSSDPMKSHNLLQVEIGYLGSIVGGMTRHKMSHPRESIHHHHNGILTSLGPWQAHNEIETNVFPWGHGHGHGRVEVVGKDMALGHLTN